MVYIVLYGSPVQLYIDFTAGKEATNKNPKCWQTHCIMLRFWREL